MALFVDKLGDTKFNVYNMKHQLLYSGVTRSKIVSLQVDGNNVVACCEGHHHWLFGPSNPDRPEQSWRMIRNY